eukprot:5846664-Amphidinium_carterae.1
MVFVCSTSYLENQGSGLLRHSRSSVLQAWSKMSQLKTTNPPMCSIDSVKLGNTMRQMDHAVQPKCLLLLVLDYNIRTLEFECNPTLL